MLTPYQFASNRPIDGIDLDGLEEKVVIYDYGKDKPRVYVTDAKAEGESSILNYYSIFSDQSDLTKEYRFAWDKGFQEYTENGGPNSFGTLTVKQDMGGTYMLSYSRYSSKPQHQIKEGFKSGWESITADTRGNRIGMRMTAAIVTAPLAAGTTVLAGIEMTLLTNEIASSGFAASNGELESDYSYIKSLVVDATGETGGDYYDGAEIVIKAVSAILSIYKVKSIKTWEDALDKGAKAINSEIDFFMDYYNKYYQKELNDTKNEPTDN
jgi:hypothetical protein